MKASLEHYYETNKRNKAQNKEQLDNENDEMEDELRNQMRQNKRTIFTDEMRYNWRTHWKGRKFRERKNETEQMIRRLPDSNT